MPRRKGGIVKPSGVKPSKRPRGESQAGSSRGRGRGRVARERAEREDSPQEGRRHRLDDDDEEDDAQRAYEEEGGRFVEEIYIPPPFKEHPPLDLTERLVIEKITCINFKSYAGVKEMGPFHKSFSAIVGPNGNGKSNIIDAMLFVFGYRATKIRCKKLSVLIHKSELLPNLQHCSVTVHFQKISDNGEDEDSFTVIPNSQIKVMRKADKSNNSTYYLNEKKVLFQEVAEFLKSNGIDIVHNRFLILQGEVESISQMPPKQTGNGDTGLLEFLEDIIGSKRYLRSLVKLEERVESLNRVRLDHLQLVDLVEKEKISLDEPFKKAKEYLLHMNEKTTYEYHLGQYECFEKHQNLKEVEAEKIKVGEHVQEILTRLNEINVTNRARKGEYEKAENEFKLLDSEHKKKKKAMDAADTEYTKNTEQLQRTNEQRKKIIKDIAKKEEELEKLDEIPVSHESEIEKLGHRDVELDGQIEKEQAVVERECAKVQIKYNKVVAEKQVTDKIYLDKKKVRDQSKAEADSILSDLNVYKQQEKVEREKYDGIKAEFEQLKEAVQQKERSARKSNEYNPLEDTLKHKREEFVKATELEKVKKAEREKLQDSLEEMRSVLEVPRDGRDDIARMFKEEKSKGRLTGLYGRLKDLATIDEKYNVATTMSTGMLDHWIVDDDDTGSKCIAALKHHGLGVQTFQPLNKMDKREMNVQFNAPPRSERLFDLLRFSTDEIRPAFYKALRNTIVTENLNIATEIAYGPRKLKVVTLKGELIDVSGQMSGGGNKKLVGKMNSRTAASLSSSFTQEKFSELKEKHNGVVKEHEELCSQIRNLDQEIRATLNELKKHKLMIQNFQNDLTSLKSQLPLKEGRLKDQEAVLKASVQDPKKIKEKEKAHEKAMARLAEVSGPLEEAEAEVSKITDKLKELDAEKKEIRRKLEKLLDMKKKVVSELNKFTIELKNYKKNRVKALEKIESLKSEKEKLQKLMDKVNEAKKRIEAEAAEIKVALEKFDIQVKESSEKLSQLKESANEFRDEENKLNKEKIKVENEFKNVSVNFDKIVGKIQALEQKLEAVVLRQIPGEVISPIEPLSEEAIDDFDAKAVEGKIAALSNKLGKEEPNLEILDIYQEKWNAFCKAIEDLNEITRRRDMLRQNYISTMSERLTEFMAGFASISSKVKELFRMISMGGDAELEILDCFDPFASGIEFTVRPARKTWKQISYLSGGEKTLSSLALVFALHYFKPSPFYVMDEIDAALDFKNVSIIANYIKERTKDTQFIIISLRSNMFELADSLLGVYKVDNMSYSIHLGVGKLIKQLKKKFEDAGKPFPLVSEYTNMPTKRKIPESRSPDLFASDAPMLVAPESVPSAVSETPVQGQPRHGQLAPVVSETGTDVVADSNTPVVSETGTNVVADSNTPVVSERATSVVSDSDTLVVSERGTSVVSDADTLVMPEHVTSVVSDSDTVMSETVSSVSSDTLRVLEAVINNTPSVSEISSPGLVDSNTPVLSECMSPDLFDDTQ